MSPRSRPALARAPVEHRLHVCRLRPRRPSGSFVTHLRRFRSRRPKVPTGLRVERRSGPLRSARTAAWAAATSSTTMADGTSPTSAASGRRYAAAAYGLTAVAADFDNDGWPDIYVACDSTPSLLLPQPPRRHLCRRRPGARRGAQRGRRRTGRHGSGHRRLQTRRHARHSQNPFRRRHQRAL